MILNSISHRPWLRAPTLTPTESSGNIEKHADWVPSPPTPGINRGKVTGTLRAPVPPHPGISLYRCMLLGSHPGPPAASRVRSTAYPDGPGSGKASFVGRYWYPTAPSIRAGCWTVPSSRVPYLLWLVGIAEGCEVPKRFEAREKEVSAAFHCSKGRQAGDFLADGSFGKS